MRPAYRHTDTHNDSISICPGTYGENPETIDEDKGLASEDVKECKQVNEQGNKQGSIQGESPY